MLVLKRNQEVLDRASHRMVTAFILMTAPQDERKVLSPEKMGVIVENRTLRSAANTNFIEGVNVWKNDDHCPAQIEKDPALMAQILEALANRNRRLAAGGTDLDSDQQRALFDSIDLINKATGLPPRLTLKFNDDAAKTAATISEVPFAKLKQYLFILEQKLEEIGGRLQSVDIAHVPAKSAFDYYEQSTPGQGIGFRPTYGHVMLAKAENLLGQMGYPRVTPVKPPKKNFH